MPVLTISEMASFLGGELLGEGTGVISGAAGVHDAGDGQVTFLAQMKHRGDCTRSAASCVIVKDFIAGLGKPQIRVANPLSAFARMLEYFYVNPLQPGGISSSSSVSETARIGKDVTIHPFVFVADEAVVGDRTTLFPGVSVGSEAVIGPECTVHANVVIREKVTLGARVTIHACSVIGSDGFGYFFEEGRHKKIPQVGGVIIGDDVEIGAGVTIDRATTGNTVIGKGTKIDNLVQIGHNITIGEHVILVAQVGIGGSSRIGNYVVLGGQAGVADHTTIDDGCMVGAQAGIMGHVTKGIYGGSPAIQHRNWLKSTAIFAKLPELARQVRELEEKIKELERRLS